jgi:hypothetical protein
MSMGGLVGTEPNRVIESSTSEPVLDLGAEGDQPDGGPEVGAPMGGTPRPGPDSADPAHAPDELTPGIIQIKDVLEGRTPWGLLIQKRAHLRDALIGLRIVYKYHPSNDGANPKSPRVTLGNIESMREDLMHLSALGPRLAALSAEFEAAAEALDDERKLARSRRWAVIRQEEREGKRDKRMTVEDLKNEAEISVAEYYKIRSELIVTGRILNWVRAALRNFAETLGILIQSSMREERAHARLS